MIFIKNPEQIKKMQIAGRITGEALALDEPLPPELEVLL